MPLLLPIAALAVLVALLGGGGLLAVLSVWFGVTWIRFHRYHRHKGLPTPDGRTVGARVRAWIQEASALVQVAFYKLERGPTAMLHASDGTPPVLCIHGFTQDRTNFSALRRELWARGRASVSLDLGMPGRSPHRYGPALAARMADLCTDWPEGPIDIVCHSMGGVLLRQVLAEHGELTERVRSVVTLGSPHHGTAGARGPIALVPEGLGMHRRSGWIAGLPTLAALLPGARTVTIAGTADYVVYPLQTCHLEGSEHLDFEGIGHAGLLTRPEVVRAVADVVQPAPTS